MEFPALAAGAMAADRAAFIQRTYLHVAGAILAFLALEAILIQLPLAEQVARFAYSGFNQIIILIAFMAAGYVANKWAHSDTSVGMQYLGLGLYVVAQAAFFLPLMFVVQNYAGQSEQIFTQAGTLTLVLFAGLTTVAFMTRKDFSFLRSILTIGFFVAIGVVVLSMIMGFSLGLLFASAMIVLASGAILYDTSNIIHHYRADQHVGASLSLFASVALLFWYAIQFVWALNSD